MKLTTETKVFLGMIIATIAIIGGAAMFFTKPTPIFTRSELIPEGTATKGNPQAEIYLVEFSDFQCPACKAAQPFVANIVEKYKDKMVFAYRHFPLAQHPFSQKAAQASILAQKSGKFWEMHDLLFANQETLSDDTIISLAKQLFPPDADSFASDYREGVEIDKVRADLAAGEKLGVASTPTFFLNGKKLTLTTFADLEKAVAEAVKE